MFTVQYILESVVCCALFLLLYKMLLEGRVSHSIARIYLVVTTVLGVLIPMMELPIYPAETLYVEIPIIANNIEFSPNLVTEDSLQNTIDWGRMLGVVAVVAFVDNTEHRNGKRQIKNPNYADFTWQTIPRDKGEVHYPVSNGVISIQAVKDVPVGRYLEIQTTILEAYAELREELAQRSFKRSYSTLEAPERDYILQAIPMRVSEVDRSTLPDASRA